MINHDDQLMLYAIQILVEQSAFDALYVLSTCKQLEVEHDNVPPGSGSEPIIVTLYGSQLLCDSFYGRDAEGYQVDPIGKQIQDALGCSHNYNNPNGGTVRIYATLLRDREEDWRLLLALHHGEAYVNNQGQLTVPKIEWNSLQFASQSEIKIAQALDKASVMFFPNSLVRLGGQDRRKNKCPDFLICHKGKWGILEVDGRPFHPSAADDHERDRLFQEHGVTVIEHYDANKCFQKPDDVVKDFLKILSGTFS